MESEISLEQLNDLVIRYFRKHARRYGLEAGSVSARYILNWGGFVNASFTVSDGKQKYHLKLADDEDSVESIKRWYQMGHILHNRYRAPHIIDWIRLPKSPFQGMLLAYFEGSKANFLKNPDLHLAVIELVNRLHHDEQLVDVLTGLDGAAASCADYFISTYIDRFDEDLLVVARDLPPFVQLSTLDWMQGETRHLEGLVRDLDAFALPANAPTHGDLWENNVLVNETGDWIVIDWDDLALGDPALEYSILLSMVWGQNPARGLAGSHLLPLEVQADKALMERLAVCLQAYLLDEVIDSLADYVESEYSPEHKVQVQAEKERIHREALEIYRQLF